jgi:hypothetical protein
MEPPQHLDIEYPENWWNTGTLIPESVRHGETDWLEADGPVTSAQYELPGWTYRPRILFTEDGRRIGPHRVLAPKTAQEKP